MPKKAVIKKEKIKEPEKEPEVPIFDFVKAVKNFHGKRIMYNNPNYIPPENEKHYIDIKVTDADLEFIVPISNEFVMRSLLGMLNRQMQDSEGNKLNFDLEGAKYTNDIKEKKRSYAFSLQDENKAKKNLVFVISSSAIKQKYGLQGTGVYERDDVGEFVQVPVNKLVDWLVLV